jgi:pimeloyl-ACP methyl ester carboxylesterase
MEDRWVRGDGVTLRCVEWHLEQTSNGGPPLLLLHGMSSNALFWLRVAAELPQRRVLALDLRGHGHSDRPPQGYTAEVMAADVASAIRDLALAGLVVAGHSWGAAIALQLAATEPSLISRLALVDGPTASLAGRMSFEEADREMRPPSPCYRRPEEIDSDTERFLRDAWGNDLRPFARASFAATAHGWCPVLPEEGRLEMVRSLHTFRPEPLLDRLGIPTLIVAASDDSDGVAPGVLGWWRSQVEAAAARCQCGEARRYDSRHDIPLIRPAQLAADIGGIRSCCS